MAILVTGGAGYIGSHTVAELLEHSERVVVVDNLTTGHKGAVLDVPFYQTDIRDSEHLVDLMRQHEIDTVVHFAANSLVGESVQNPLKYYENNVTATSKLLYAMVEAGVQNIVFSSTAAVYREPDKTPIESTFGKSLPILTGRLSSRLRRCSTGVSRHMDSSRFACGTSTPPEHILHCQLGKIIALSRI